MSESTERMARELRPGTDKAKLADARGRAFVILKGQLGDAYRTANLLRSSSYSPAPKLREVRKAISVAQKALDEALKAEAA